MVRPSWANAMANQLLSEETSLMRNVPFADPETLTTSDSRNILYHH